MNFHRKLRFPLGHTGLLWILAAIFFLIPFSLTAFAANGAETGALPPENPGDPGSPHTSAVRTGVLGTKEGLTLHLTADLGSVRIIQIDAGSAPVVRYTVRLETDARGGAATKLLNEYSLRARSTDSGVEIAGTLPPQASRSNNAQFWVQFEVAIPRNYNVDVNTDGGDITTDDIGGTASLRTQGGNITAGRIGGSGLREVSRVRPVARLETQGGHIKVLDVAGDLTAFTAGGHINAGNISADASLHTGGGHIRAGKIGGRADLETAGGNITVGQAGSFVSVHTGGGQIDFGEVRGSVRAQTGGGGIHVMYVSGPMEVESNGGSICLTGASGTVQAATSGGSITAWINPPAQTGSGPLRLEGASQLSSGTGDIIVYLPRNLAAYIDAVVANGTERYIEADSALHLTMQSPPNGSGPVHAVAALNGGGAPLKLRTNGGKIRLKYIDAEEAVRESLLCEQADRLNQRLLEAGLSPVSFPSPALAPGMPCPSVQPQPPPPMNQYAQNNNNSDWLESWLNSLELAFRGGISEDPDDFLKRVTYRPSPSYPDLARRAGIHGVVRLQVRVAKDGHVEVQKVLEGEPVLVDAAIDAVKRWRAKPAMLNGKPAEVISTIKFDFQLR
ncbi:MAG TPA: energy transducer TonB [Candidatus Acidoferrum sp.]|nr:energy transducer TonB [Candidatus Acidoferrum sp.]